MGLVIVTGMFGTDKTVALKMLEDLSFYCVDNLPAFPMDKFAQPATADSDISQVALNIDIHSGEELSQLDVALRGWKELGMDYQIPFLNTSDGTLTKRCKETRRSHPLVGIGRLDKGIEKERIRLTFLKKDVDFITDTSKLLTRKLRQELEKIFLKHQEYCSMSVTVLSFDSKHGILKDVDLVFDMRFLPNPHYSEDLRLLTGEDQSVWGCVMQRGICAQLLDKFCDMMDFLLSNCIDEGKNQLVAVASCTGGKHRSMTVARTPCAHPTARTEYGIKIEHRSINKDNKREQRTCYLLPA